jgi:hypothetical protein
MVGRSRLLWGTSERRVHSNYSRNPLIRGYSVRGYATFCKAQPQGTLYGIHDDTH